MVESKADFARRMNWNRSTATRYAKAGRIVLAKDGQVEVEASHARLAETADPRKEGVRQRHARERKGDTSVTSTKASASDSTYELLNKHRAAAEEERSILLRLEREEKEGKLGDLDAVRKRALQLARGARDAVLNMRFRIDPLLAGEADPAKRAEIWDRESRQICDELARGAAAPALLTADGE